MVNRQIICPNCGTAVAEYKSPMPVVDIIIEMPTAAGRPGVVLIERKNEPHGWAIPGGFVDYSETVEAAAVREAKEETGLDIRNLRQMQVFSDPARDPRYHTISTVFIAEAAGTPRGGDDAAAARVYSLDALPDLVFDHAGILDVYLRRRSEPNNDT
jgi:8-oxo-dGTP diphosphatase